VSRSGSSGSYQGEAAPLSSYPDTSLTVTSIDGGVILANIPPGEYTLTATKQGKQFSTVAVRCRAGLLVNAAPPHGLQGL
jgi:hypothetical protein